VPLDALAVARQYQQQQQQQVLQQLRLQYQQRQLQQLQQQGLLVFGDGDVALTVGSGKPKFSGKAPKLGRPKGKVKDPAVHVKNFKLPGISAGAKAAKTGPPRVCAAFTGPDGLMAGWPDRTYMPGSDRDRVWQEHRLVMRVLSAALQSQPQPLAAVQQANSIFLGRSCTTCWQARPINGQWCCTKPLCYRAAAEATSEVPADELLRSNWAKVKEVDQRLRSQAGAASATAAAAATDLAVEHAAAEDATDAAAEEAAAVEAAAALAALAGSSHCSNTAEDVAGDKLEQQDTSKLGDESRHAAEQQQQQRASSDSTTTSCALPGGAGHTRDASNTDGAGSSQPDAVAVAPVTPAAASDTALETVTASMAAAASAAAAAAPGNWPVAGPIAGWAPPSKEYSSSNADMQRLWREHQLNIKVLAVELQEQPEALVLLQRIVDL
jgi:hypothetical protein